MPIIPFDRLPDHARLWVFAAERPLGASDAARLLEHVDAFLASWHAHQQPLACARDWRYDQFLLVGVDEASAGVSGCSVDALVRTMKALGQELGLGLLDHASVFYREAAGIRRAARDEFAEHAAAGRVSPETTVFDNTVTTAGAVREGRWEGPAAQAWHGRAFFDR